MFTANRCLSMSACLSAALALTACEGVQDTSATVTTAPTANATPAQTAQVTLQPITRELGLGELPGRIGERTTIGSISMGYVTLDPPPEAVMTSALRDGLAAKGYGTGGGSMTIGGEVTRFALSTPATATYWDVTIDAEARISLNGRAGTYTVRCVERTYLWPSDRLIAGLARACADQISAKFLTDRGL